MTILTEDEKQTVKRTVPKASNKILGVAVAKLYVAHPNRSRWTYTGLQGAVVLANDTVGNTFWLKLVDISPSNRGVIWDQEIYDTFQYNQDRTFFHSFELEECLAGLSFVDEKEAKKFKSKMDEREKNAHKNTRNKPFNLAANSGANGSNTASAGVTGSKSRFGIGSLLGHKSPAPNQAPTSMIPPRDTPSAPAPRARSASTIDTSDPAVRNVLDDLLAMGITEDQIQDNAEFIKSYLAEQESAKARAPPPPPPAAPDLSPQTTGGSSRRGPPPAPPPSRRGAPPAAPQRAPSPSPSPPPSGPKFKVPPPIADAGKLVQHNAPPPTPSRNRAVSNADGNPGPPPPPRQTEHEEPTKFGVPPPFTGNRVPPPPARGPVPPPPPRDSIAPAPPPLPPKVADHPIPPPLPPASARAVPPPPGAGPPLPPPLPPTSSAAPPPPPLPPMSSGGPPPPPPPPPARGPAGDAPAPPPLPPAGAVPARGNLLADIRGGARLRKVSEQEKRDRSAAAVPGTEAPSAAPAAGGGGGGAAEGGLAGALASALAARKSKVSHSDDEDDGDDW